METQTIPSPNDLARVARGSQPRLFDPPPDQQLSPLSSPLGKPALPSQSIPPHPPVPLPLATSEAHSRKGNASTTRASLPDVEAQPDNISCGSGAAPARLAAPPRQGCRATDLMRHARGLQASESRFSASVGFLALFVMLAVEEWSDIHTTPAGRGSAAARSAVPAICAAACLAFAALLLLPAAQQAPLRHWAPQLLAAALFASLSGAAAAAEHPSNAAVLAVTSLHLLDRNLIWLPASAAASLCVASIWVALTSADSDYSARKHLYPFGCVAAALLGHSAPWLHHVLLGSAAARRALLPEGCEPAQGCGCYHHRMLRCPCLCGCGCGCHPEAGGEWGGSVTGGGGELCSSPSLKYSPVAGGGGGHRSGEYRGPEPEGCSLSSSEGSVEMSGVPAVKIRDTGQTKRQISKVLSVSDDFNVTAGTSDFGGAPSGSSGDNDFASFGSRQSDATATPPCHDVMSFRVNKSHAGTQTRFDLGGGAEEKLLGHNGTASPRGLRHTSLATNEEGRKDPKWSGDFSVGETSSPRLGRNGCGARLIPQGRSERRSSSDSLSSFVSFGASVAKSRNGAGYLALTSDVQAPDSAPDNQTDVTEDEAHKPHVDVEELQESFRRGRFIPGMLRSNTASNTSGALKKNGSVTNIHEGAPAGTGSGSGSGNGLPPTAGGGDMQGGTVFTPSVRCQTASFQRRAMLVKGSNKGSDGQGECPQPEGVGGCGKRGAVITLSEARREVCKLMKEERLHTQVGGMGVPSKLSSLPTRTLSNIVSLISRLCEETDVVRSNYLIVAGVCAVLKCDRASVFLVEGSFVRSFDDNGIGIKVPMDKSLVGHAALNGSILNIPNAYDDPRFNKDVDKKTGYTTRNLLVYPITRSEFRQNTKNARAASSAGVFAVIEAINKEGGTFTAEDETILALLGKQAGVLLSNSHYCQQLENESYKTSTLLEVSKEISDVQVDLGQMMEKIMTRARQVLTVERASVFLLDEEKKELWSILTDSEMATRGDNVIRLPVGVGLAGTVAKTGEVLNIDDVYSSPLFNSEFDRVTGFATKSVLCVPIRVSSRQGLVIGVMQYINKNNGHPFNEEDCSLAATFSTFVGISLNNLLLYDELREGALVREKNKELVRLRDKAKQAADAKANFLMAMSHEIRTPMSGVIGMTELLEQTTNLDREQEEMVTTIKNCGESLLAIINDILDFGRLESGKMELDMSGMSLVDLTESTIDVVRGKAEPKSISVHLDISAELHVDVIGDAFRLKQVLINLLGNAVKFTPDSGEILVRVFATSRKLVRRKKSLCESVGPEEDEVLSTALSRQRSKQRVNGSLDETTSTLVEMEVRDTGIGIPREKHHLLFLPFHQASAGTTRQYGGSGLGLSICKQLVEVMGGDIFVDSEVGKGSSFSVVLPFRHQEGCSPLGEGLRKAFPIEKSIPVLIVSAKQCQLDVLSAYFNIFKAECRTFESVEALCACLKEVPQKGPEGKVKGLIVIDQSTLPNAGVTEIRDVVERVEACATGGTHTVCIISQMVHKSKITEEFAKHAHTVQVISAPPKHMHLAGLLGEVSRKRRSDADTGSPKRKVSKAEANRGTAASGKSLLVAEDNPTNQMLIKKQLGQFGIQPTICDNGKTAIDALILKRHDMVFMDCHMPELDGYGASKLIREMEANGKLQGPRIPIVALTADALPHTRSECLDAGMDDYVTKPIRKGVLQDVLKRWFFDQES